MVWEDGGDGNIPASYPMESSVRVQASGYGWSVAGRPSGSRGRCRLICLVVARVSSDRAEWGSAEALLAIQPKPLSPSNSAQAIQNVGLADLVFLRRRMSPITMPLSTALHMS